MKNALAQMSDAEKKELRNVGIKLLILAVLFGLAHLIIPHLGLMPDVASMVGFDTVLVAMIYPLFIFWTIYAAYLERRIWLKHARVKGE